MNLPLQITETPAGVRFAVHVQPRASSSALAGIHGDALKIRLAAPPVDGAANDALVILLSKMLGCPRSVIAIVSGATGRRKVIEIEGITAADVRALIDAP